MDERREGGEVKRDGFGDETRATINRMTVRPRVKKRKVTMMKVPKVKMTAAM